MVMIATIPPHIWFRAAAVLLIVFFLGVWMGMKYAYWNTLRILRKHLSEPERTDMTRRTGLGG